MRVVDTSAWIEFLIGSDLGGRLAAELPERAHWLVPTMVQLDLAKWLVREDKADLLTCDRHFEGLPGVRFVAKTGR